MRTRFLSPSLAAVAAAAVIAAVLAARGPQGGDVRDAAPVSAVSDTGPEVSDNAPRVAADSLEGFVFEVRDTPAGRERGLSGRESVPPNYGMLFAFDLPDRYGFWMKEMRVPIDIVWLSDGGVIVGIEDSVRPESYPAVFYAPQPVRFVLETRAGEARARGWGIGTDLALPLPYE